MSASLVGSEMCIRDSRLGDRLRRWLRAGLGCSSSPLLSVSKSLHGIWAQGRELLFGKREITTTF
eukprot:12160627-Alexandrium_andersonii.AAC.1